MEHILSYDEPRIADLPVILRILEQWTDSEEAQKYTERIERGIKGEKEFGMQFWVLKEDGVVVGIGGLADPLPSILEYASSTQPGELKILYLDGKARGLGKGGKFLAFLEQQARAVGRTELLVRSAERYRDTAFGFYERSGYENLGQIINQAAKPMQLFRKRFSAGRIERLVSGIAT